MRTRIDCNSANIKHNTPQTHTPTLTQHHFCIELPCVNAKRIVQQLSPQQQGNSENTSMLYLDKQKRNRQRKNITNKKKKHHRR